MPKRNAHLDLLRAVAVTMVIVGHCPAPPSRSAAVVVAGMEFFRRYGGLGVDLFFVLSGFLVSGLLFREQITKGSARVGRFLIRRGFKIYPAFYLFLLVTVLLRIRQGDTSITGAGILSEGLFVQNYAAHVWSHTWSLAVEEHFYLLLALIVIWLQAQPGSEPFRRIPMMFLATTLLVTAARAATFRWVPYSTETHRFPTHLEIDSLFFGVVLSFYYHIVPGFAAGVRRYRALVFGGGAVCLVAAQASSSAFFTYVPGHVLTYVGFGAVVIAAVCTPVHGPLIRRIRPIVALGEHSYSVYLWHTAVLVFGLLLATKLLGREPTFYETLFGYVALAFGFGVVMAKAVELPALRLRDWLVPDRSRMQALNQPAVERPAAET